MITLLFFLESVLLSTGLYIYLHKKTKISIKYLYLDNIAVILPVFTLSWFINFTSKLHPAILTFIIIPLFILGLTFLYTMIRFWRTPTRKIIAGENEIISPADGNIIYIKRIEAGNVPVSIKKGHTFKLNELTKTNLLETPCWLIGINMTPFDVHKNCSPISGIVTHNEHFNGEFLSLKKGEALIENERNTYIIENNDLKIGIIQIASRLVRRIDVYVNKGQAVKKGDWIGMIRFGSQVDVIIPEKCKIGVEIGQQVYAAKTIIARF